MKEFSSSQAASVEVDILDDSLLRAVTAFMQQKLQHELAHGLALRWSRTLTTSTLL